MCEVPKNIILCSCEHDLKQRASLAGYTWILNKSEKIKNPEFQIMGKVMFSDEISENEFNADLLKELMNSRNCFDFEYTPKDDDLIEFNNKDIGSFSFLFKNEEWTERTFSFYEDRIIQEQIAEGKIEFSPKKNIHRKSINPFKAKVTFGLYKGYSDDLLPKEDVFSQIKTYQEKLINTENIHLSVSVSETTIVLSGQKEPHLVLDFINYPKFPLPEKVLKSQIEKMIEYLMNVFEQNRIVIEYLDETIMLEKSEQIDPKIMK